MSYELLADMTRILSLAGIPAGEEYPGLERPEINSPSVVVGLRELDATAGTARYQVRVLSPRLLGGWCCQDWAARVARALTVVSLSCRTEEMEYRSGSDCFCITVEAVVAVVPTEEGWKSGIRWRVFCGDTEQEGVAAFTANRDLQRRVVGTHWKTEPVGITSSSAAGGWKLELVQDLKSEPAAVTEPFALTILAGDHGHRYTDCYWNETVWEYTQRGPRLTRRGFALGREEI